MSEEMDNEETAEVVTEELEDQSDDGELSAAELAASMGWRPEEDFKGPKDKWVDADTFLANREKNLGIAKDSNKRLEQTVRDQAKKLKRAEAVIGQLKTFEDRAYQRALSELKAQQKAAVEDGDTARFDKLDKELDDLRANAPAKEDQKQVDMQEVFTEWLIDNSWYKEDSLKQQYADLQFEKLGGVEGYDGTPDELLFEVTERVNKRFASKDAAPKKVNPVNGGNGMRVAPKGGATAASLNAEEKQMGMNMVRMGIFKSVDDYAKELRKNG